ncbi:trimeric intracellular cation channel family protein [Caldivirga sp. UBA161]|uniref:trimeric intracellular cation channel family protein n=1 Tax=Caldivirga sp. UBA161 TaxID=1915569 RepID=UPI0025BC1087|nr:trimeric intracellular cation channel family protein [Caldivirga sp. UBA161]
MSIALTVTNYVGIVAFAVSGSIKAIRKGMDLLGIVVLGFTTALGGGIISNIILGIHPPINLTYLPYPLTAISASLATFIFYKAFSNAGKPLMYADAVGLGAFSASGASLAYSVSHNPLLVVLVGSITAVGGGVIRDLLSNEVPVILTREFYASAAILGSLVYFLLRFIGVNDASAALASMTVTIILRFMALRLKWELPRRVINEGIAKA